MLSSLESRNKDYSEEVLNHFIEYSSCPVISLESCTRHPLQSLADMVTIEELSPKKKPRLFYRGPLMSKHFPSPVPNSFAEWALAMDHDLTIVQPEGFELASEFTQGAKISYNQDEALEGADIVYVKNWSSLRELWCLRSKKVISIGKLPKIR